MENNSIEEILEAFHNVRVELLDDNARLLFETIMREFDKRDNYKKALNKIREIVKDNLNINQLVEHDILKIIDEVENNKNE